MKILKWQIKKDNNTKALDKTQQGKEGGKVERKNPFGGPMDSEEYGPHLLLYLCSILKRGCHLFHIFDISNSNINVHHTWSNPLHPEGRYQKNMHKKSSTFFVHALRGYIQQTQERTQWDITLEHVREHITNVTRITKNM